MGTWEISTDKSDWIKAKALSDTVFLV